MFSRTSCSAARSLCLHAARLCAKYHRSPLQFTGKSLELISLQDLSQVVRSFCLASLRESRKTALMCEIVVTTKECCKKKKTPPKKARLGRRHSLVWDCDCDFDLNLK